MKSSADKTYRIGKILLFGVMLLAVSVICMTAAVHSNIRKDRPDGDYTMVQDVEYRQIEKADTLMGVADEYRFILGETGHAATLAFRVNHHNVEVYIGDRCVYAVTAGEGNLRTVGGVYAMIPLYDSDVGKEVRVVISSLYENYRDEPDFYVGSELAIYKAEFFRAVPEMVLSICSVIIGLFLLCLAVYHSIRHYQVSQMYATGLLALSAGVWRFTYGRFAYLLFQDHSALVYTISVIAMMMTTLAMLGCVRIPENRKTGKKVIRYGIWIYCGIYMVQLLLQFMGVMDLRQQLTLIHLMIVFSAMLVLAGGILSWFSERKDTEGERESGRMFGQNYSWLLGIGAIADLLLYYYADSSFGMLFILGAILGFSMLEGFRLLMNFSRQRSELEEMETKLTLSRTATMMSQIRSHFVFNLLNAISGMCKYDPEKADDTVVRFARYLRNNIDIMQEDKNIPFEADLKQVEDYVALEQVRFGDKVEFYTDIETTDFMIPPLILQPVVENAIKHGISKKEKNGTIILKTRDMGEYIVITVEDDGIGFDMAELSKEKSVGLRNIRFRLEHLVNGTFKITSRMGAGTTVTIKIPKTKETRKNKA